MDAAMAMRFEKKLLREMKPWIRVSEMERSERRLHVAALESLSALRVKEEFFRVA